MSQEPTESDHQEESSPREHTTGVENDGGDNPQVSINSWVGETDSSESDSFGDQNMNHDHSADQEEADVNGDEEQMSTETVESDSRNNQGISDSAQTFGGLVAELAGKSNDGNESPEEEYNEGKTATEDLVSPIINSLRPFLHEYAVSEEDLIDGWLNYILGSLTGNDQRQNEAINKSTDQLVGVSGQSTLQSQTINDSESYVTQQFDQALGHLIEASHESNQDVLKLTFEQLGTLRQEFHAQYFTPAAITELMTEQAMPESDIEQLDGVSVSRPVLAGDPACGTGPFLIALRNQLTTASSPPPAIICGQDIDPRACKASVINMAIHGIPGFIIRGDTLKNESEQVWRIGPVAADSQPTLVAELEADYLPDGFGTFTPESDGPGDPLPTVDQDQIERPKKVAGIAYEEVPSSLNLYEAHNKRLDPSADRSPNTLL